MIGFLIAGVCFGVTIGLCLMLYANNSWYKHHCEVTNEMYAVQSKQLDEIYKLKCENEDLKFDIKYPKED